MLIAILLKLVASRTGEEFSFTVNVGSVPSGIPTFVSLLALGSLEAYGRPGYYDPEGQITQAVGTLFFCLDSVLRLLQTQRNQDRMFQPHIK